MSFGLCYNCKDGQHDQCIGVPCECPCPVPPKPETFELSEEDRQAVLLALAKLSLERPGWYPYLGEIAAKLSGKDMYEQFRSNA